MKSMMFPFSIRSETIEMDENLVVTPKNGRMFSC